MGILQHRKAERLTEQAARVAPLHEPLRIHFGNEGSAPPGTRLVVCTGPQGATEADYRREDEKGILEGRIEMNGDPDMTREAIVDRWRAAGLALPGEPDYKPDNFDEFYARLDLAAGKHAVGPFDMPPAPPGKEESPV